MNIKGIKTLWRLAVSWFTVLFLAMVLFPPASLLASHDGPILVVDASASPKEDTDGDYHFRTIFAALNSPELVEYSMIQVKPGSYSGPVELKTEGITLRSTKGARPTLIEGVVRISARNTTMDGFSLEAASQNRAVEITADGVVFINNRVSFAEFGVVVIGVQSATLSSNHIYSNKNDGLSITDSWNVTFADNELRSNGGSGAHIKESRDITFSDNLLTGNRFGGLWLTDSQRTLVNDNFVQANDIVGIAIQGSSESTIRDNHLIANEVGLVLGRAIDNSVLKNTIKQGRSAGLVMKNGASGNIIQENLFQGNQGKDAMGIRLAGDVFGNRFESNQLTENGAGLVLVANESGIPANNLFQNNKIGLSDSVGILIELGADRNQFIDNEIYENLGEGILSSGTATVYEENRVYDNGSVGLSLNESNNGRAERNMISQNGAEGILLMNAKGMLLADNRVLENVREGFRIMGSDHLRLTGNEVSRNGASGLNISDVLKVSLLNNIFEDNQGHGATIQDSEQIFIQENEIFSNGSGGLRFNRVQDADLSANHFARNLHYGLFSQDSDVSAGRNYWGDPQGPAGAFAGSGNSALGLEMEDLIPWLPAKPDDLEHHSVSSQVIEHPDGIRIEFDATDRLGMIVEIHNPEQFSLAPMGIITAARFNQRPEDVEALNSEVSFYVVSIDGLTQGTAEITLFYKEEDQPIGFDPQNARIYIYRNEEWESLPGSADPDLMRVSAEIPITDLIGAILGIGSAGFAPQVPDSRENEVDQIEQVEDESDREILLMSGIGPSNFNPPRELLIGLIAFLPLLILFGFYLFVRSSREVSPERGRLAHSFRIWPL
jgi:parallel beta-helix repeat protein